LRQVPERGCSVTAPPLRAAPINQCREGRQSPDANRGPQPQAVPDRRAVPARHGRQGGHHTQGPYWPVVNSMPNWGQSGGMAWGPPAGLSRWACSRDNSSLILSISASTAQSQGPPPGPRVEGLVTRLRVSVVGRVRFGGRRVWQCRPPSLGAPIGRSA
jgi:hypothetical protein